METLTDKKCRSRVKALAEAMDEIYDRSGLSPASESFWRDVDTMEENLSKVLLKRPVGNMEIDLACKEAMKSFTSAIAKERSVQRSRTPST